MADNMFSELSRVIDVIGKDKGIDKQLVVDAVVQGMLTAARKKWGTYRDIEAQYNEESGEVELFQFREVVKDAEFVDEEVEIKLTDALELDPDAQVADSIGSKLETGDLGRIAAQTAKQIITQKVRDAERDIIFNEFEERKGEIASGIARRVERGAIVVDMGRTEAYIPPREQIPGEQYKPGDRIQGYIAEVRQTTRGPQIIMSRADERYLVKLFEVEVPEIYDGIVEIKAAAREPGQRAKIAVITKDAAVDPVGACVGMKGTRVQNIVQELRGEKIDIVKWDEEVTHFVCNALAPAEISKVIMDEENQAMEVVIPDADLSKAIGRKGQNVRLAAKLTGWKIDIVSESAQSERAGEALFNLTLVPSISETIAQSLYQHGYASFQTLSEADASEVVGIPGFESEDEAKKLIADCQALVKQYEESGEAIPVAKKKEIIAPVGGTTKAQAEELLKKEMEQLSAQEGPGEAANAEAAAETPAEDSDTQTVDAPEEVTNTAPVEVMADESATAEPEVETSTEETKPAE